MMLAVTSLSACGSEPPPPGSPDPSTPGGGLAGGALLSRLGGLWSGSASQTPLGTFPIMNMDLRAADSRTLFSRTDLDAKNNLRFAFLVETHAGRDVLVFRNGGYFLGILRDTRAELLEVAGNRYRFCAVERGCDYLQAIWDLPSETELTLDVKVRGQQHVWWPARRVETRSLPQPFPADFSSQGTGDAPFPPMPALTVDVIFNGALAADADVWLILTQNGCMLDGCVASRQIMSTAPTGSTHLELSLEQLHGGSYQAMALLDRGRSFATTLRPNRGDGITWPLNQAINAAATGTTQATLRIAINVP
jgi:hypothetical protein